MPCPSQTRQTRWAADPELRAFGLGLDPPLVFGFFRGFHSRGTEAGWSMAKYICYGNNSSVGWNNPTLQLILEEKNSLLHQESLEEGDSIRCCELNFGVAQWLELLKKEHLLLTSGERTKEETSEVLCIECSIVRTLRRSEEKRLEAFEMLLWRSMERVKWTDRIRNEVVLERVDEERMILKLIRKRKRNSLGHEL
ncbi:hypothetical protein ANN_00220 [Periplaneta americana]|uniref:Uncharacterized protein n=1 Tax=Periplaneta americana TaxID=6978 RepID=A0ABQ8TQG6_PERAM|nr:hypothetical protein ANN_00220 [Periplaneta americana]